MLSVTLSNHLGVFVCYIACGANAFLVQLIQRKCSREHAAQDELQSSTTRLNLFTILLDITSDPWDKVKRASFPKWGAFVICHRRSVYFR